MYVRILLEGCRCVELDCDDGRDGEPDITHVGALCSRIKFQDVVEAINDAAWLHSTLPVFLSLEMVCAACFPTPPRPACKTERLTLLLRAPQHCSFGQQGRCAAIMSDTFGDRLLLPDEVARLSTVSPEALDGKVVIKGKPPRNQSPPHSSHRASHASISRRKSCGVESYSHLIKSSDEGEDADLEDHLEMPWEHRRGSVDATTSPTGFQSSAAAASVALLPAAVVNDFVVGLAGKPLGKLRRVRRHSLSGAAISLVSEGAVASLALAKTASQTGASIASEGAGRAMALAKTASQTGASIASEGAGRAMAVAVASVEAARVASDLASSVVSDGAERAKAVAVAGVEVAKAASDMAAAVVSEGAERAASAAKVTAEVAASTAGGACTTVSSVRISAFAALSANKFRLASQKLAREHEELEVQACQTPSPSSWVQLPADEALSTDQLERQGGDQEDPMGRSAPRESGAWVEAGEKLGALGEEETEVCSPSKWPRASGLAARIAGRSASSAAEPQRGMADTSPWSKFPRIIQTASVLEAFKQHRSQTASVDSCAEQSGSWFHTDLIKKRGKHAPQHPELLGVTAMRSTSVDCFLTLSPTQSPIPVTSLSETAVSKLASSESNGSKGLHQLQHAGCQR